jgi:PAS domain S-box-containing protein
MEKAIRLLILEDNLGDVGLVKHELKEAEFHYEMKHVFTKLDFLRELEDFLPEVILADYTIPGFGGMEALSLVKELAPALPFIFVTGTIDEHTAVECMKAGAVDYVLKDSLKRIVPAIKSGIEKRKLNSEKKQIEEQYKFAVNILENIRDSIIVTNTKGEILYWNRGATLLFGYSPDEMIGKTLKDLYPDQNSEQFHNEIQSIIDGKEYMDEWKGVKNDGGTVWVSIKTCLLYDNNDKMIGILGVAKDITEAKKNKESLEINQLKTNSMLNAIPDLLIRLDKSLNILDIKIPKGLDFFKAPEELTGKNLAELSPLYSFITKELIGLFSENTVQAIKTGKIQFLEYKLLLLNNIFHFELRFVISGKDEVLVLLRDITGTDLPGSGKSPEYHKVKEFILHHNTEGKIIYANIEMINLLGYSSLDELKNKATLQNIFENSSVREDIISSLIINGKVAKREVDLKTKDGTIVPLVLKARLVKDTKRNNVYFELNLIEKQEINLDETQIKKLQKLESLSTMGSSIAYDFNNFISNLGMNIYITEQALPEFHPVREHIENIKNIFNQAEELTGRILNFNNILKE